MKSNMEEAFTWTTDQVVEWLCHNHLDSLKDTFKDQEIDGATLSSLTDADLVALAPKIGPRARLRKLLQQAPENERNHLPSNSGSIEKMSDKAVNVSETTLENKLLNYKILKNS